MNLLMNNITIIQSQTATRLAYSSLTSYFGFLDGGGGTSAG